MVPRHLPICNSDTDEQDAYDQQPRHRTLFPDKRHPCCNGGEAQQTHGAIGGIRVVGVAVDTTVAGRGVSVAATTGVLKPGASGVIVAVNVGLTVGSTGTAAVGATIGATGEGRCRSSAASPAISLRRWRKRSIRCDRRSSSWSNATRPASAVANTAT